MVRALGFPRLTLNDDFKCIFKLRAATYKLDRFYTLVITNFISAEILLILGWVSRKSKYSEIAWLNNIKWLKCRNGHVVFLCAETVLKSEWAFGLVSYKKKVYISCVCSYTIWSSKSKGIINIKNLGGLRKNYIVIPINYVLFQSQI